MKKQTLDRLDKEILRCLGEDGRLSWSELGKRVNLSVSATQRRVEKLQQQEVISGFKARLNPKAMGYDVLAFVDVRVERQNLKTTRDFRAMIEGCEQVRACYMISGDNDYRLEVIAESVAALGKFMLETVLSFPGVRDASSSLVFDTVKEH